MHDPHAIHYLYLLETSALMILIQTAAAALRMGTVLHMIYGKTVFWL